MVDYNKYLIVTEQDKKWDFNVISVGYSHIFPNEDYPRENEHPPSHAFNWNKGRVLDAYYLIFIARGAGIFESSVTDERKIIQGTCFFLFPGVWHRYKPDPASGWEEYWVGFKGPYPDALMNGELFIPSSPFIDTQPNEKLLHVFQQLIMTVRHSTVNYQPVIAGMTLQLLGIVNQLSASDYGANLSTPALIERAVFMMQENIENVLTIEEIAKNLLMGYSAFRKAFKELKGTPPNQYYLDIRLKKAQELMHSTNLNFKEIAFKTGFESPFYFSKFFKKRFGVSPKIFKSQHHHE